MSNFAVLMLFITHYSGNIAGLSTVCLHINWKVHTVCGLNFMLKCEGLLKVTCCHVHWKRGNIFQMMLGRDVVTTRSYQEVILVYGLTNSSKCNDRECP